MILVIIAIITIGFIGFMVWGHHMFNVGFDVDIRAYYSSSTSIIAISIAIKIFNWLFTIWSSAIELVANIFPIIYLISYFYFHFNELTGVLLLNCLLDILFYDIYFIVGHFHYVLSSGAVYFIFAAIYMHFHYFFTFLFIELISRLFFLLFFISSNLLFFPMHSIGILGHSRRIFDYPILFSYFHYFQSLGISGILLAIICLLLLIIIMFILLDEFIMSFSQRRSGPMNVGYYGLTAPLINAFSLFISTIQYPKSAVIILLLSIPILFILFSFLIIIIIHPLFNIDIGLSFIIFIILYSIIELFIILSSLSSSTKYAILGSIRIIGIIIAFELILSCSIIIIIAIYYSIGLSLLFIATNVISIIFIDTFIYPIFISCSSYLIYLLSLSSFSI